MENFLWVGLGGGVGAMGRYLLSLLPWKGGFPLLTLLTNLLGAAAIGVLAGLAAARRPDPRVLLFWKTGVCGGFTTFSTFSLESLQLLERGAYGAAGLYIFSSAAGCLLGVWLGRRLGQFLAR